MKNKSIAAAILATSMIFPTAAYAEEIIEDPVIENPEIPAEDPREYPNTDILEPPSQDLIEQDPWRESSSAPEEQVPSGQDEPEGWAVVDENGNTLNIIVCDIDYCGSGWIPTAYDGFTPIEWARVVLQSKRDPQTGNSNGGHWGQYNFPTGIWTNENDLGEVYVIPKEYGEQPFCISNCPVPEEEVVEDPSLSEVGTDPENTVIENTETVSETEARSFKVAPQIIKNKFLFSKKFHIRKNIVNGKIWIIATKNNKKIVWKIKAAKRGKTKIEFPNKYFTWDIKINYKLKNGKKIGYGVILKN